MWFGRWRQFCFWPTEDTVFNIGCMNDIAYVIRDLHDERRGSIARESLRLSKTIEPRR